MSAKRQRSHPRLAEIQRGAGIHLVHDRSQDAVCNDNFLKQADGQKPQAPTQLVRVGTPWLRALRKKIRRPDNRAGDEVREEGQKQRVIDVRVPGQQLAAIDVHQVGNGLKGVKRNPERENNIPRRRLVVDAELLQNRGEVFQHKIAILEIAQQAEID